MTHDHAHSHDVGTGHDHGHGASERRLLVSLSILFAFTLVEGAGGWFANSIALLAEAGHMLADCASLLLAVVAIRIGRRPADTRHTFGASRYQTLAAYTNGLTLLALTVWVMAEAVKRLIAPPAVNGELMLGIALLGGLANLGAFVALLGASSLNERSARAHVFGDLLGSGAAVAAALLIIGPGWTLADPILSVFVSFLILRSGWRLTAEAGHVLLQGTPPALDPDGLARDLLDLPGVSDVHHLHVWSLTGESPVVTLHAAIDATVDRDDALQRIHRRLREIHNVFHATVQVESGDCHDIDHHPCHGT